MIGMGDRVCVDLCSLMKPGEGLLVLTQIYTIVLYKADVDFLLIVNANLFCAFFSKVGSFARGLFLVHSECLESNYISSRPFRVNAVSFFNLQEVRFLQ